MKKIFYEKVGRKYIPVAEYDSDYLDSFPKGTHLVMVYPGGQSRRFNIDPNYAALIAAGRIAEEEMCKAINKASELRPPRAPITPKQLKAWQQLKTAFGDEICTLQGLSVRDVAEAGINALQVEADKLMSTPAVKKAYEQFILMCKLTKEQHDST